MAALAYLDNWITELEASGTTADTSLPSTTGDDRAFLDCWIAEPEQSTKNSGTPGSKEEQAGGKGSKKQAGSKEGGKPGKGAKANAAAPKVRARTVLPRPACSVGYEAAVKFACVAKLSMSLFIYSRQSM